MWEKELRVPNSRDFGIQFWIITVIDFINFQPNSCIARVPSHQSAVGSSRLNQTLTSRSRFKRSEFPIVRYRGYSVVSINSQLRSQAGRSACSLAEALLRLELRASREVSI